MVLVWFSYCVQTSAGIVHYISTVFHVFFNGRILRENYGIFSCSEW